MKDCPSIADPHLALIAGEEGQAWAA